MISEAARRVLIAYDITDDPRRARIAKTLESYGDRIQYSVFLVYAKPARIVRLRGTLSRLIDPHEDSILLCDLGQLGRDKRDVLDFIGLERTVTGQGPLIL